MSTRPTRNKSSDEDEPPEWRELVDALSKEGPLRFQFIKLADMIRAEPESLSWAVQKIANVVVEAMPRLARRVKDPILAGWAQELLRDYALGHTAVDDERRRSAREERAYLITLLRRHDEASPWARPGRPRKDGERTQQAYALRDSVLREDPNYPQEEFASRLGMDLADWKKWRKTVLGMNWAEFKRSTLGD